MKGSGMSSDAAQRLEACLRHFVLLMGPRQRVVAVGPGEAEYKALA
jgi:hypothetical protein